MGCRWCLWELWEHESTGEVTRENDMDPQSSGSVPEQGMGKGQATPTVRETEDAGLLPYPLPKAYFCGVNIDCQFDRFLNHHGNKSLALTIEDYLD